MALSPADPARTPAAADAHRKRQYDELMQLHYRRYRKQRWNHWWQTLYLIGAVGLLIAVVAFVVGRLGEIP
ncbi:hypothetical protein SAMN05421823_10330 [Catalinimonas alkaloidigena]|uniref:Uncharacterized protein n=1 Tax=Catalinimonas alkaloidigena TaxID=1075417 RepID=A0A1G9D7J4_9BACT|nr:hypothetical protein [Catalinimonas alkaloidigena]SDK59916.1 hypothetical protein SAMN05421823_10330 [Catalinimonas alkaloidigena]